MNIETTFSGMLFAGDVLKTSIAETHEWQALDDAALDALESALRVIFEGFPSASAPNESQTEDDLIWPVLQLLGWTASLRQQNLSARGREDVPDGLLFADDAAKHHANGFAEEWRRYELGAAVVESKRWVRPLDRRSEHQGEETTPSTQMLRYLRRVDDLTTGKLRWGILTNGAHWRLYYQGARSVSEQFFEVPLAAVLDLPGHDDDLFALSEAERRHWLKLFVLFFRREAFLPVDTADPRTFHERALEENRFYQQRIATNLSDLVFSHVFPELARAIVAAAPDAPLGEVRDAALVLLYRLLFIMYAEDRNLLPVRDERYDDYGLREKVRGDVGRRKDRDDTFSETAARYWSAIDDLCRAIDQGDPSIGLPPYDGGLFARERTPLLTRIRLGDRIMADIIDTLSFVPGPEGRRYINYRDLSVQHLGSIYERLLEQEVVREETATAPGAPPSSAFTGTGTGVTETIGVRPNVFARKDSGSYYTPDALVGLILEETIGPLVRTRLDAFAERAAEVPAHADLGRGQKPKGSRQPRTQKRSAKRQWERQRKLDALKHFDPAERLLDLKVCDPAMGSGHFLAGLVDYLADRVIEVMAEAEAAVDGYVSPLAARIDEVRTTILSNAEERGWTLDPAQLDDRRIIRRMVLKRCVYGVDKNPMAVELAKVSLWLHTFTAGAPLGFLDHHLRCGDSLFGCWVRQGLDKAERGGSLFLRDSLNRAFPAAQSMQVIEMLSDADIDEADHSAGVFAGIRGMTAHLDAFLSLVHASEWLTARDGAAGAAFQSFFTGAFGDPVEIASGVAEVAGDIPPAQAFLPLLERARALAAEERFLHWQVAFPGVWSDWESSERSGGFDAVVGNPPWDRMKLQQVEWFVARRPAIARAQRAADRRRMIAALRADGQPLADEFERANERAATASRVVRTGGEYPYLSCGDMNLYSLFVERAMALVKPKGVVGLLVPSGIASDKTAARFFRSVATAGRLRALYDFENRKVFFPDVHASFKFCVFVAGRLAGTKPARCAFYLHDVRELEDSDRRFPLTASDFARVNPNTGTAPIFRSRRAAELTTAIYGRLPVLVDRSTDRPVKAWPVKYATMFHMTNDSGLFRTREELEEKEGAWPIGGNRFDSPAGEWVPLYEGKMVQAFDHRAANIVINPENLHRPALTQAATLEQHQSPDWLPAPQFWVNDAEIPAAPLEWFVGWKDVTATTNVRTIIAALIPRSAVGNTFPVLLPDAASAAFAESASLFVANLNAIVLDYLARQKVQGQHLNLYIVEQLPVVSLERCARTCFGPRTALEVVREAVLELTYTARDMAPFARNLGYLDNTGAVKPPFRWNEERRLKLRAKLDAVFFHLYGITGRDDVRYVYSTFPIVERQETAAYGHYRSLDLCLAWMNALAAGRPDAEVDM